MRRESEEREQLVRRLAAAVRGASLYAIEHPVVVRALGGFTTAALALLQRGPKVTIGCIGDDLVVDDTKLQLKTSASLGGFIRGLRDQEIEKITLESGATAADLKGLVEALAGAKPGLVSVSDWLRTRGVRHVAIGKVAIEDDPSDTTGIAAALKVYRSATSMAEQLWQMAKAGEQPDPAPARKLIEMLTRMVTRDRTSLMALTALKKQDTYTFTHMVNVSVLTIAQARSLNLAPSLTREFGLAALMHDIGKIHTPTEILNKPDKLTKEEFDIMKRHVIDGASILRRTPDMPALAPVVAFEHHLRLDRSGYPQNIVDRELNLCTLVVTIADVFDALRSKRAYREGLASARVRAMMAEPAGMYHPTLLRRFINLVGMFPAGSLVLLNTDEVGIVTHEHPADPFRPQVRIAFTAHGEHLEDTRLVNTWERNDRGDYPYAVVESVDPSMLQIDPLSLL
jgi:putative nucleotidyltransferase with HDIG domain